jgi:hypothetical protein
MWKLDQLHVSFLDSQAAGGDGFEVALQQRKLAATAGDSQRRGGQAGSHSQRWPAATRSGGGSGA